MDRTLAPPHAALCELSRQGRQARHRRAARQRVRGLRGPGRGDRVTEWEHAYNSRHIWSMAEWWPGTWLRGLGPCPSWALPPKGRARTRIEAFPWGTLVTITTSRRVASW